MDRFTVSFFAVIGAFVDEEENVQTEESFGGSDLGTGTVVNPSIRKDLGNPKSFKRISVNKSSIKLHEGFVKDAYDRFPNHFREDDGTAFSDAGISMKVYSVDDDGVLAGYGSNVVYVETPEAGYVDGSYLKAGVYVRNGTYRYTSADGACRTVPAFKKVTSEKDIQIFNAMSAYLVEVINENDYNSNKRMSCESWAIEN